MTRDMCTDASCATRHTHKWHLRVYRDEFARRKGHTALWDSHIMRLVRDGSFEDEKSCEFKLGEQFEIYARLPA